MGVAYAANIDSAVLRPASLVVCLRALCSRVWRAVPRRRGSFRHGKFRAGLVIAEGERKTKKKKKKEKKTNNKKKIIKKSKKKKK